MPAVQYNTAAKHPVVNGPCDIESITVLGGVMGQIDVYDAVDDDTGTAMFTIAAPFPGLIVPRTHFGTGFTLKLAAATNVLVQRKHIEW